MRLLIALLAVAIITSDATAGPLARLRARRSGGCTPAATTSAGAMAASAGCANGSCSLRR